MEQDNNTSAQKETIGGHVPRKANETPNLIVVGSIPTPPAI